MEKPNYLYQDSESVYKRVSQDVFDGISPLPHWVKIPEGSECFVLWEGEKNTFYKDNFNLVTTEGGTSWTPCGWEGENKIKENGGKLVWCEEGFDYLKYPELELKSVGVDVSEYAHLNTEGTKQTEKKPIKSDGGSSDYYKREIPELMLNRWKKDGVIEAKDVMKLFLGNDYNFSNSFKAHCRVQSLREGVGKEGVDEKYDLRKAWFFGEDAYNDYLERG